MEKLVLRVSAGRLPSGSQRSGGKFKLWREIQILATNLRPGEETDYGGEKLSGSLGQGKKKDILTITG